MRDYILKHKSAQYKIINDFKPVQNMEPVSTTLAIRQHTRCCLYSLDTKEFIKIQLKHVYLYGNIQPLNYVGLEELSHLEFKEYPSWYGMFVKQLVEYNREIQKTSFVPRRYGKNL